MNIEVRAANVSDLDAICRLLILLFEQEADFEPDYERQVRGVQAILSHPERGRFLVVTESGHVVGVVSLQFLESTALGGRVALLEDMIIHPNRRGQGLGKQLLSKALTHAQEQGCLRVTVLTDHDNRLAQALYEKLGFTRSRMIPMRRVF